MPSFIRKIFPALGRNKKHSTWVHVSLFAVTFFTCILSGMQWAGVNPTYLEHMSEGVLYAVLILTFLSAHEFGHYFAAKYHKVNATLPYYIPFPFVGEINFGTFGAVIKTLEPIPSKRALFDIGVAGPLAGFVVCVIYLLWGFTHLPDINFIYKLHPYYLTEYGGKIPEFGLTFGDTLFFTWMKSMLTGSNDFVPPMNEIYHLPFLNVGWFGLFVTTLNMLPMGQLDGGHISYAMFGHKHKLIAKIIWYILLFLGTGGFLGYAHEILSLQFDPGFWEEFRKIVFPVLDLLKSVPFWFDAWGGWLFWAFLAKFFIKLEHPPVWDTEDIGLARKAIGYFAFAILIASFSYRGIFFVL